MDSRPGTHEHIYQVQNLLNYCIYLLSIRLIDHDYSKTIPPELDGWNEMAGELHERAYGSPEYFAVMEKFKPVIEMHYRNNRHHPEHHTEGIRGMNLIDLLEMVCDWEAAARRGNKHALPSLDFNQARFGFSDDLKNIIGNTLAKLEDVRQ